MKRNMIAGNICWLDVKLVAIAIPIALSALWPLFRLLLRM